jgi:hypothetical protein
MKLLSKSKVIAFRQCRRRLWLEVHRPELRRDSAATRARMEAGRRVGEVARRLYDPRGEGVTVALLDHDYVTALVQTAALLRSKQPIFEAAFAATGAMAFADVLLPHRKGLRAGWRMVEVKSSTRVKDHHLEDVAVQALIARAAGAKVGTVAIAHIDGKWTYPGGDDYRGLLVERDLTSDAGALAGEAEKWIAQAMAVTAMRQEPEVRMGEHCTTPFECGFAAHCRAQEPAVTHPVQWLPRATSKKLRDFVAEHRVATLEQVPDELLNEAQRRVKAATLQGREHFDLEGSLRALRGQGPPCYFLDFETTQFAVPAWPGTRPYQQLAFQFCVYHLTRDGALERRDFVDLAGDDPRRRLAATLVAACGERGPIFAYNAAFEAGVIGDLAEALPPLRARLLALVPRLVDLLPIACEHYYHPSQEGSWSFKAVLPAAVPGLDHGKLEGVADGTAASAAYHEAIHPLTLPERKAEIERQLLRYCGLDTYGMVRLWRKFAGREDLRV